MFNFITEWRTRRTIKSIRRSFLLAGFDTSDMTDDELAARVVEFNVRCAHALDAVLPSAEEAVERLAIAMRPHSVLR